MSTVMLLVSCIHSSYAISTHNKNVIYITLDGTRYQDFFEQKEKKFPFLWNHYAHLGELAGGPTPKTMSTASIPVSLPSYLSMTTGQIGSCASNTCPIVQEETLFDKIAKVHQLTYEQIAVFSSWNAINKTISAAPNIAYVNTGNHIAVAPYSNRPDKVMSQLNHQQKKHPSSWDNEDRMDSYTYRQAKHYLQKYKPQFMWIALGDADEYAHDNNQQAYLRTLRQYDRILDDLFHTLKDMPEYAKDTTIIVTTDHGRGDGTNWTMHGPKFPESKQSFLFVLDGQSLLSKTPPKVKHLTQAHYTTLSIRPLIETIMGS
jgi:predicted AlkP superfamily pyrophosphatase or phosphodiesterase